MAPPCLAHGRHRILQEQKREEGLLHHERLKTVHSPRSLQILELVARHRNTMLRWLRKNQYHQTCYRRRAQRPTDHIDSRCRFHSIPGVRSDWQLLHHLQ
jgi:hypothetical protein